MEAQYCMSSGTNSCRMHADSRAQRSALITLFHEQKPHELSSRAGRTGRRLGLVSGATRNTSRFIIFTSESARHDA